MNRERCKGKAILLAGGVWKTASNIFRCVSRCVWQWVAMDSYDEIYAAIAFGIPCFFLLFFLVASFLSCLGPFELWLLVVF